MASYSTNELRTGIKVMLDGDPCIILSNEMIKPGKGQAFNRIKLRNLKTGRVWERTFKSGESIKAADIIEREMEYLYNDGDFWYFMDSESFDQFQTSKLIVADAALWLCEQDKVAVTLYNGAPLSVTPPNHVELEVVETDPGMRGDTAQGGTKPAKLSTGAIIKVPLFVQQGERVRVDTRNAEYLGRA